MSTIVVGVDGSTGAADALRWAVAEGARRRWPVEAVLCWTYLDQRHPAGSPATFDPAYGSDAAAAALDAIVLAALGEGAGCVRRTVVNDHSGPGLVERTGPDDLLVVGARGVGALRGAVLGSVSSYCLRHARGPVAVIRPGLTPAVADRGRVVVGVDGSEDAVRALAWAAEESRLRDATLVVVHAWSLPAIAVPLIADPAPIRDAAGELVEDALVGAGVDAVPPDVEVRVVSGSPAAAVLEVAEHADLLVVGSRGRGGFRGLLLGSVSHQVATHASCPVVVVRA